MVEKPPEVIMGCPAVAMGLDYWFSPKGARAAFIGFTVLESRAILGVCVCVKVTGYI